MENTTITKKQGVLVEKAIKFLNTLEENNFCRNEQTKGFDPKNIGVSHCIAGHLLVNPKSPIFSKRSLCKDKTELTFLHSERTEECKQVTNLLRETKLVYINNYAPRGKIKESVINALKELKIK